MAEYVRYPGARDFLKTKLGLELAEGTLRRMVSGQRIPFVKVPGSKVVLFSPAALEEWVASGRVQPQTAKAAR
jgi:excisionase family DNA binding protein